MNECIDAPFRDQARLNSRPRKAMVYKVDHVAAPDAWSLFGFDPVRQTGVCVRVVHPNWSQAQWHIAPEEFPSLVEDRVAASPWSRQLSQLRDALGLPITALAEALGVTRPAYYDWLRGEQPNRSNQQRIRALSEIAEAWERSGLGSMSRYWNVPSSAAGIDLRSLLTDPDISLERFNAATSNLRSGRRVLPKRESKPRALDQSEYRRTLPPRKPWGTTSSDAE